mmetsp:Transcript_8135/g.25052  ORF Transcript_8135/g.25052 Transcript_8135/m.25052 type:complete len:260 (-) Transcript_8135:100-879(-)
MRAASLLELVLHDLRDRLEARRVRVAAAARLRLQHLSRSMHAVGIPRHEHVVVRLVLRTLDKGTHRVLRVAHHANIARGRHRRRERVQGHRVRLVEVHSLGKSVEKVPHLLRAGGHAPVRAERAQDPLHDRPVLPDHDAGGGETVLEHCRAGCPAAARYVPRGPWQWRRALGLGVAALSAARLWRVIAPVVPWRELPQKAALWRESARVAPCRERLQGARRQWPPFLPGAWPHSPSISAPKFFAFLRRRSRLRLSRCGV